MKVTVTNLTNEHAPLRLAVFREDGDFEDENTIYKGIVSKPGGAPAVIEMELPAGDYALAVYQDLNSNGKMDKNLVGIPKEPFGFSRNFKPRFSAPDFEDCQISLTPSSNNFEIKLMNY